MHADPDHLRAGVEAVTPRQECKRVDVAAKVSPLAGPQSPVNCDEDPYGRVEELEITF